MKLLIASKVRRLASALKLFGLVLEELGSWDSQLDARKVLSLLSSKRFRQNPLPELEGLGLFDRLPVIDAKITFVFHLHYEEYLHLLLGRLDLFNRNPSWTLLVSTSNDVIFEVLKKTMNDRGIQGRVIKSPNRGRNFAPLLVDFNQDILQNEFVVHLHSKRSTHISARKAKDWALDSWKLLFLEEKMLKLCISSFQAHNTLGLFYIEPRIRLRNINLTWGRNFSRLQKWLGSLNLDTQIAPFQYLDFPPGGMFAARVEALKPLLLAGFGYEDFPDETGQVDGTLQHAIERAIGAVVASSGFQIASYDFDTNGVYLERGFEAK